MFVTISYTSSNLCRSTSVVSIRRRRWNCKTTTTCATVTGMNDTGIDNSNSCCSIPLRQYSQEAIGRCNTSISDRMCRKSPYSEEFHAKQVQQQLSRFLTTTPTTTAETTTTDPSSITESSVVPQHPSSIFLPSNDAGSTTNTATNTTPSSTTGTADTPTTTSTTTTAIPETFYSNLYSASIWQPNRFHWNINVCRLLVAQYDTYLRQIVEQKRYTKSMNAPLSTGTTNSNNEPTTATTPSSILPPPTTMISKESIERLLSADMVVIAFKVLIKCKVDTPMDLAANVRQWERYIGHIGKTPLTDHLSLRLLTANAKSGNLGRCLSLLELRTQKQYPPRIREFIYTITAIQIAAGKPGTKNIYLGDTEQSTLDNPTRWLDAILLNMKQRNQPLNKVIAYHMLSCYAGIGYTGKATHHFYRVLRHPVDDNSSATARTSRNGNSGITSNVDSTNMIHSSDEDDDKLGARLPYDDDDDSNENSYGEYEKQPYSEQLQQQGMFHRPRDWFYVPALRRHKYEETQVKIKYNRGQPPYYKIPAQVQGKLLRSIKDEPGSPGKLRIERESEPDYSIPLAAAFAFAHSLQQGACGHDPITFNVECYNALIKACVYRGALWRAMHVLDTVIKNSVDDDGKPLRPNHISYNMVLAGLARVGDVVTAQRYYHKMLNEDQLEPDAFTVRAIVDGLLNLADAPAAITVVQDFFNQHSILPPYTTHCKILEFCLARGMIYEAKRYVYFIQQLWYWKPVEGYHSKQFIQLMRATQRNTQLQKPALQKIFAYFGESLTENDFL